ncbi:hypothetical protein ABW636_04410 [Aquimarina sp. 2201CG1-2-11]|uniref:hypothetical protein n=1 Tax=Aquimarina discodermiae TaxID=3231043 RepID=UPI0034633B44
MKKQILRLGKVLEKQAQKSINGGDSGRECYTTGQCQIAYGQNSVCCNGQCSNDGFNPGSSGQPGGSDPCSSDGHGSGYYWGPR